MLWVYWVDASIHLSLRPPPPLPSQSKLNHIAALIPLPRAHAVDLVLRLPVLLKLREERLAESYRGLAEVLLLHSGKSGQGPTAAAVSEPLSDSADIKGPRLPTARLAAAVRGWPELLLVAPVKVAEQV